MNIFGCSANLFLSVVCKGSVVGLSLCNFGLVESPPPVGGKSESKGQTNGDINSNLLLKGTSDWSNWHC